MRVKIFKKYYPVLFHLEYFFVLLLKAREKMWNSETLKVKTKGQNTWRAEKFIKLYVAIFPKKHRQKWNEGEKELWTMMKMIKEGTE